MRDTATIEESSDDDIEELLLTIEARINKARRALERYRASEDLDDLYLVEVALEHGRRTTGALIEVIEGPEDEDDEEEDED